MWEPLRIRRIKRPVPIVQGGMGVGVSLAPLSGAVSREGGLGTVSGACLDRLVGKKLGVTVSHREAASIEVSDAKYYSGGEPIAINLMVALDQSYEPSVLGAMDGGVDAIVSGAGLPLRLPAIVAQHKRADDVALIPIVSSGRALRLVCNRWQGRRGDGRLPDAAVLEGPAAGGHLGWKTSEEVIDPANNLENLLPEVLEVAADFGGFPVIVAGGIYTHDDIDHMFALKAAGVQLGTRFLATIESSTTEEYKRMVVDCKEGNILVSKMSPCGLLFRVLTESPMHQRLLAGQYKVICSKGYVLQQGRCLATECQGRYYCICNGLLSSGGFDPEEPPLYTVGANGFKVDKILSVADLMNRLRGLVPDV